ncbi:spindle pole body component 110-like isoform X2 [Pieris rapae]|uniref:spindle pole body component 110-like isoform X2 n=1 Tax=Pieris rapae TaxID=64459 RepID=UPI001E27AF82|nr:spindle pole body component 110-like isoform X2 [Pieris rapae]
MMFNGLLCDSDCNYYFKESSGPSSIADSVTGAERTRCLQDKLHATLQILKNKEETVKVQAESLALAEARLSALAIRTQKPNTHRALQVQPLQKESGNGCKVEMTDVSVTAHTQSAKQEQLLENHRGSYLQMRLREKEKDSHLSCLQHVVDTQRASAFAYQDIASEVDHLKAEISNFLNNSNNDSGMWERTEDCDITTDLRHIAEQLHRLQDMLTEDCSCGLYEENRILKRANETNERVIDELRERISKLEDNLENKENSDQRYETVVAEKEDELRKIRNQLNSLENTSQRSCCCDQLSLQLQQVQGSLNDKTVEMVQMQRRYEEQNLTIFQLRQELDETKTIKEEEVSKLRCEVLSWRSQKEAGTMRLRQLQKDLQRSQHRYIHLADHYKEISSFAQELQTQLKEAQTRGAKLCGEARHLVCAVRHSLKRQRNRQREQNERIKEQETIIQALQDSDTESALLTEPCCSKYLSSATSSKRDRNRSVSETASTPPRRLQNKTSVDENDWVHANIRNAGVQQPTLSSCGTGTDSKRPVRVCSLRNNGEVYPTEELLERVERAHEALSQAQRRWCHRAPK